MKNILNLYFRDKKRKKQPLAKPIEFINLNSCSFYKPSKNCFGFNSILYSSAASFIQSSICLYVCLDLSSKNENIHKAKLIYFESISSWQCDGYSQHITLCHGMYRSTKWLVTVTKCEITLLSVINRYKSLHIFLDIF
jgi:hypothetical protein